MLTHLLNFFIVTKRISDWHHFCKLKFLYSILQVEVFVGTMQLTLSLAIMQVTTCYSYTVSVAIRQLEVSAANMRVTTFIVIMQMEVSVAIMKVVFSAVHYARLFPLL